MISALEEVSRRAFLKYVGKTVAASGLLLSGCSLNSAGESDHRFAPAIDIHHHYFPPELVNEIKDHGKTLGIEYFPPKDPADRIVSLRFTGGNRVNYDPRLIDVEERLTVMNQGQIG